MQEARWVLTVRIRVPGVIDTFHEVLFTWYVLGIRVYKALVVFRWIWISLGTDVYALYLVMYHTPYIGKRYQPHSSWCRSQQMHGVNIYQVCTMLILCISWKVTMDRVATFACWECIFLHLFVLRRPYLILRSSKYFFSNELLIGNKDMVCWFILGCLRIKQFFLLNDISTLKCPCWFFILDSWYKFCGHRLWGREKPKQPQLIKVGKWNDSVPDTRTQQNKPDQKNDTINNVIRYLVYIRSIACY